MILKDYLQPYVDSQQVIIYAESKCVGVMYKDNLDLQDYNDCEVTKAWVSNDTLHIQCRTNLCKYYKTRTTIRKLTDYERGFYRGRSGVDKTSIEEKISYCTGTRECDSCYCEGDPSRCTFYKKSCGKSI